MPIPKHILVIRFSAMGDVAMTVPVLRALTKQYPKLKITVVTNEFFKPFFISIKNVSVFTADLNNKHKGVLGLYKLSKELKAIGFDAVADLHNVLRSKILKTFFLGKKTVQIDKGRSEKRALISGKHFKQLKTTHQRYADVFETLGYKLDLAQPTFPKKTTLKSDLKSIISNHNKPVIGIAPFASFKGKMYPLDKMKEAIEALSKEANIILFGGKAEAEELQQIEDAFKNTKSVAGKLNLNQELDVISNLDVMLSMDSGNAHIAAMLGIKTVTLWGVTHPFAGFTPFNQPQDYCLLADRNLYPKIPTSVYGNTQPEGYENAAASISVDQVVKKVLSLILKKSA